jgi:hypothetical protein
MTFVKYATDPQLAGCAPSFAENRATRQLFVANLFLSGVVLVNGAANSGVQS